MDIAVLADFIDTSSSSEDNDDFENFNFVFHQDHRCNLRRIPRVQNYIETVIHRYNNEEFRKTCRFLYYMSQTC